jgi:uncharacterized protein (TIGR00297 family)
VARKTLAWQSKLVLLLVIPFAAVDVILKTHWWAVNSTPFAIWTVGLSLLLGLVAFKVRSATAGAAAAGAVITASLMYSTAVVPYVPWRTALIPVLAVLAMTTLATRLGRAKKERMGFAEARRGRSASQVAANLGVSALVSSEVAQSWIADSRWLSPPASAPMLLFAPMLAALAEAAADTVSSEVGEVFGGWPRLVTTLRRVDPGTDGGVTLIGTLSGAIAAGLVALAGALVLRGGATLLAVSSAAGVFGLLFDSLLGATLEQRGWLSNDLVNFLSTAGAAVFALVASAALSHTALR